MRKILSFLAVMLSLVWFIYFRPAFLGGPASYIIVSGVSMEPTLYTGDLAVMQRQAAYAPGDIVAFRVPGGHVIHRIVGGSAEEGFITRGDNKTSTDPWRPRPEDIAGRMWFHIPGGGRPLQVLRQPKYILALGGLAAFLFLDDTQKVQTGRKRKGKRMNGKHGTQQSHKGGLRAPSWGNSLLGALALVTFLAAALAVYAHLLPAERPETVERLRYEHQGAFEYTLHSEPSLLNPQPVIGPIGPDSASGLTVRDADNPLLAGDSEGEPVQAGPPVFTRLARSLDLAFTYRLVSDLPADVHGQARVDMQIQAGEGWTKVETLTPAAGFSGTEVRTQASIDFQQIMHYLETVEEQTGFEPGTYEISLIPHVQISGEVDGVPVNETYAPAFRLQLGSATIDLDGELARSEVRTVEQQVLRPNTLRVLNYELPVDLLRRAGLYTTIAGVLLCALLAAVFYLGIGMSEAARVQARYGSQIVHVTNTSLSSCSQKIEVAGMQDLARLAQRDGGVIFHQNLRSGADVFFVPDGQVVYLYRTGGSTETET
ncbi:MAG: signal peptidase I [Chloroflexi bacterium]|nr:signal peptidase I [Chloroflexota bacterium]